jgi:hypothetical protein
VRETPVGPSVTKPNTTMPAPSRIEIRVATSESNENRKGAAIESTATPYSARPCTYSGTVFLRSRRSWRTGGFGPAFNEVILEGARPAVL